MKDLKTMLLKAPDLIDGLIEISQNRKWIETTIATLKLSQCLIQGVWSGANSSSSNNEKSQSVSSPTSLELAFKQLPFLSNDEDVKKVIRNSKVKNFSGFLRLSDEEKSKAVSEVLKSNEEKEEFLKVCHFFPILKIDSKLYVEEDDEEEEEDDGEGTNLREEKESKSKNVSVELTSSTNKEETPQIKGDQIFEQDLVTLKIIITRENLPDHGSTSSSTSSALKKGKKASTSSANSSSAATIPPVYAPYFPGMLYDNWWILVTDKPKTSNALTTGTAAVAASTSSSSSSLDATPIHAFDKIVDPKHRVFSHECKFYAPNKEGKYELNVYLFSDAYLGCDEVFSLSYEVFPASLLPEYKPHPEDIELDNEPTMFEQLMAANADDSSEDDDEDDDDEDDGGHSHPHSHSSASKGKKKPSNSSSNKKEKESKSAIVAESSSSSAGKNKKQPVRVVEEVEEEED
jgi:translocation protein SEC63